MTRDTASRIIRIARKSAFLRGFVLSNTFPSLSGLLEHRRKKVAEYPLKSQRPFRSHVGRSATRAHERLVRSLAVGASRAALSKRSRSKLESTGIWSSRASPRYLGRVLRELDATHIVDTAAALERRIVERFEGSGLGKVAKELGDIAREARAVAVWLARPIWTLRVLVGLCLVLLAGVIALTVGSVSFEGSLGTLQQLVPFIESLINDVVFVGIGIYFLLGVEVRIKRNRAAEALHVLRSLAHIVDMHQLTKDPERLLCPGSDTPSSPKREMTAFELTRYLDYCSEILSIISKIAALYVQHFRDPVTSSAASDLEALTGGLSRKIWQKIMLIERLPQSTPTASD